MKNIIRVTFILLTLLLVFTSCADDASETIDSIINTDADEIKTVEYSAVYFDAVTGLPSYSTGTLEITEPLEYSFISDKVRELSEIGFSINSITKSGNGVTVDFSPDFFFSSDNSSDIERSVLTSLDTSLKNNFAEIKEVHFALDGENFYTPYHSFLATDAFDVSLLDAPSVLEKTDVSYTLRYYDIVEDAEKEFSETKSFYGDVDPMYFIGKLSELMSTTIIANSAEIEENRMTIDFSSTASPLAGTGSYEESRILDSIADVMFSVYPNISEIYITADGADYNSGHIYIPKETPYATRKTEQHG